MLGCFNEQKDTNSIKNYDVKTVLLTGATGFWVATLSALLKEGHRVVVLKDQHLVIRINHLMDEIIVDVDTLSWTIFSVKVFRCNHVATSYGKEQQNELDSVNTILC